MNEAAALPSRRVLLSRTLKRYYGRLRRPPGSRSASRLNTGYRTRRSDSTNAAGCRAGEGLPSSRRHHLNVPRPLRRGVPRGCNSRLFTPSVAFAVKDATRLSLPPTPKGRAAITTRQASLDAADRSVAPPCRALDAGLRPGPFPDRPASLLPGLLAATRTGLTPAGDDELMSDQVKSNDHLRLWAHSQECCKSDASLGSRG
jgi:hypothetical protein